MIKINPKGGNPLSLDSVKNDSLVFDVPAKTMYVTGVPFNKTYEIFKKNTELGGGVDGLVPAPSYLPLNTRFLREDGIWDVPDTGVIKSLYIKLTTGNLDTLLEPGKWYYSDINIEGTPNGIKSFELYVGKTSDNQIYLKLISDSGTIWFRQYKDNNWNNWIRWYTDMNTDFKVTQSSDNTTKFRPIILGYNNATLHLDLTDTITQQVYTNTLIYAQPSTGTLYANRFEGTIRWDNVINKPTDFTPSQHKQAYTADECTSYTEDSGYLGVTPAAVRKAFTIIDPKKHTHSTDEIIALTGYAEVLTKASLTPTDTLNRALGKLDYKSNLGVSAYDMINAAYDGDGKIENLTEILKVLEGISDTLTIKGILGNYRLLTKSLFYGSEVESKFWIGRCNSNGGGWAYEPISIYKSDKTTIISRYGVLGKNNSLTYTYIGTNSWTSLNNLRIYPNGTVTAPIFQGKLNYTYLTGSTSTPNQVIVSTGTPDEWTLKTLGSHAFDNVKYLPITGGTLSGSLTIMGAAANKPLTVRGIVGSNGDSNGTVAELYLQYGVNKKLMLGNDGNYYISETGDFYSGKSNAVNDIGNGNTITFSCSKPEIAHEDFTYLAGWNGYELRTINKNIFALNKHNHNILVSNNLGTQDLSDTNLAWTSNITSTNNGTSGYASQYGFPCDNNANGILLMGTHGGKFGGLLGISSNGNIYYRFITRGKFPTSTNGASWKKVLDSSNFTEYTVTKTGGGASGTWNISVSGSSARTIGTLNLVAGRFSAKTFNGSTNVLVNIPTHTSHLTNDSGFITSSTELSSNITTITKSLKVTLAWMDTGIQSNNLATGTYIVLVFVHGESDRFWYTYSSGIMSWYANSTNASQGDEIILHRAGHALGNIVYLRTLTTNSGVLKLLISASKDISTAYEYIFKFKRVI